MSRNWLKLESIKPYSAQSELLPSGMVSWACIYNKHYHLYFITSLTIKLYDKNVNILLQYEMLFSGNDYLHMFINWTHYNFTAI